MKIEDIKIEYKHIGEEVTFFEPNTGSGDSGFISSFNDSFIFVTYKSTNTSQATRPEDLYWGDRELEFKIKYDIMEYFELEGILNINNFKIYISGEDDRRLNVSIKFEDELLGYIKYSKPNQRVHPCRLDKKYIRRKIQLSKLI